MEMNISNMRRQHDELAELTAQLSIALEAANRPTLSILRWRLARVLMEHLALEDRCLYPFLKRNGASPLAQLASRFQTEMGGLASAFTEYMSRWNDEQISQQWIEFQQETMEIVQALENRIQRENVELYPLIPMTIR